MENKVVGVDIGGTNLRGALVNKESHTENYRRGEYRRRGKRQDFI